MIVLAGPNGAGKSTLYATRLADFFNGPFINADIIQRDELGDPSPEASYKAAESAHDLAKSPNFGFHPLTATEKDFFAMTVTRNWRLSFTLGDERTVADLDKEDDH